MSDDDLEILMHLWVIMAFRPTNLTYFLYQVSFRPGYER